MSVRTIAAAIVAALCVGAGATTALAHTEIASSSPRDGATLRRLPAAVTLTFEEPIGKLRGVTVKRAGGANLVMSAATAPTNAARVVATLRRPGRKWQPGRYTVAWTIVAADGDTVRGVVRFRVRR